MLRTVRPVLIGLLAALLASGCAGVRQLDGNTADGRASAAVLVPYQFQVQAIDATVLRDSFHTFDGRDQTLRVAPGEHALTLRYFDLIKDSEDRSDDYARVLSEPISVRFKAAADSQYAVVGKRPQTPAAGQAFAAAPTLAIKNRASGETVSRDVSVAEPEVETIRRGSTMYAPVGETKAQPGPERAPPSAPPQSLQMLKYWWNSAGQAERDRFEAWRATGSK